MKKLFFILFIVACSVKELPQSAKVLDYSTPEAEGISSNAILNFIEAAEQEQPDGLHSFMLVRHGKIVAEGWWEPYDPESPHWLYSLSKSFTSTAIGFAAEEGLLSIDDEVISFFPDKLPENPSDNLRSMRIRDLLTMNTGHEKDASGRMQTHEDGWVAGFLSLDVEFKPGTKFTYNSGATYMLSAILQKVTGQTLIKFLEPRLFGPLDIETPTWQSDPEGINIGGWGLSVTTKDIAKFGQLYLQKGRWNGKQVLRESWVSKATSFQTSNGSNPESDWDQGYGYQFWRCRHNGYRGDGAFGQFCIVLPDQDAVIAITSGLSDMQKILDLVWDHLLPAMQFEALPKDDESLTALKNKLENLELSPIEGEASSSLGPKLLGKTYVLNKNDQELEFLEFDLDQIEKYITFGNSEGKQQIQVGFSSMLTSIMNIPHMGETPIATSGAWTADDRYRTKIYMYETPHAITYDFKFDGEELIVNSEYNVMFGDNKLPQIEGRTE